MSRSPSVPGNSAIENRYWSEFRRFKISITNAGRHDVWGTMQIQARYATGGNCPGHTVKTAKCFWDLRRKLLLRCKRNSNNWLWWMWNCFNRSMTLGGNQLSRHNIWMRKSRRWKWNCENPKKIAQEEWEGNPPKGSVSQPTSESHTAADTILHGDGDRPTRPRSNRKSAPNMANYGMSNDWRAGIISGKMRDGLITSRGPDGGSAPHRPRPKMELPFPARARTSDE